MKDIVIIANFCRDFSENDNGRFMYLCKELSKQHNVEIITSDFIHSKKEYRTPLNVKWPFKITFLHETGYPTNVCLKRFYSHWVWGRSLQKYLNQRKKPDVVYCAVPSLSGPLAAAKYCRKNDVKFIVDIQDLWPEAFKMVLKLPVVKDIIFAPFDWIANGIYKRADEIVAVSDTYVNRALKVNKKCKAGHAVYLGTRLETFDRFASDNRIKKPDGELWLAYCGTLGASYDLTCVIDALAILAERGITPPKFMVMGDGPKKESFENYAKLKGINAEFTAGRLPYGEMCGKLCACDITVNPITKGAAQSIINKHGDYASSGKPILSTQESPEYRALVDEYKMGFNCKNNDAEDLAEKLNILIENEELRLEMGRNARRCAEERFDRNHTYKELVDLIVG